MTSRADEPSSTFPSLPMERQQQTLERPTRMPTNTYTNTNASQQQQQQQQHATFIRRPDDSSSLSYYEDGYRYGYGDRYGYDDGLVSSWSPLLLGVHFAAACVPVVAGLIVGRVSTLDREDRLWYARLDKPENILDPSVVYSVVWPIMYVLMGVSAFVAVVFSRSSDTAAAVYLTLVVNLGFNLAYPLLMFKARDLGLAMVVAWGALATAIVMLVVLHVTTTGRTWAVSSAMWTPYAMWLVYASVTATVVYHRKKSTPIVRRFRTAQ